MNLWIKGLVLCFLLWSMSNTARCSSENSESGKIVNEDLESLEIDTNTELSEEELQAGIQAELNLVAGNLTEQGLTVASIRAQQELQAMLITNLTTKLQNQQLMFEQASTEQEMAIEQLEAQLQEQVELNANISTQLQQLQNDSAQFSTFTAWAFRACPNSATQKTLLSGKQSQFFVLLWYQLVPYMPKYRDFMKKPM